MFKKCDIGNAQTYVRRSATGRKSVRTTFFGAAAKHTIHWHLVNLSGVVYCGMISKTRRRQVDLEAYTQYHARYEHLRS